MVHRAALNVLLDRVEVHRSEMGRTWSIGFERGTWSIGLKGGAWSIGSERGDNGHGPLV